MPEVQVRKKFTAVEEIFHEGGPVSSAPLRRAAALAVIRNPFAGAYVKEIAGFMDDLKPLGLEMARSLVAALGGDPKVVEGLRQGRHRRLGRRTRARRLVARARRLRHARDSGRRESHRGFDQKGGRPRHPARCAHHAHQCFVCEKSFRCHGSRPGRFSRAPTRFCSRW